MGFRVVVAGDSAGVGYKNTIKADLENDPRIDEVIDAGINEGEDVDYPHIAVNAARMIAEGKADRGVFICGTGLGVAMAANKVKGIRAAQEAKVRDLAREADQGRQTFAEAARPVLESLMRETGAAVLLDRSTVVMLRDGADLTAAAIARIDTVLGDGTALPPSP